MSAALYSLIECSRFKQIKLLGFTAPSNRPTYMVLIWAWCSELGPRYRNRHRSSEGPGEAPPEAVPGEGGGPQVV